MRLLICLLFGLLTPLLAQQAGPSIRVGESVLVSRGLESRPLTEPHLVAHPTDPNHLLGATIVSSATAAWSADQYCAAFLSRDGGRTWTRHDFAVLECGDPWVGITAQGTAVFTVLARHRSLPDTNSQLLVFLSADGGRTWNQTPQSLGRGHDHQTVAADAEGRIYILSGQGWRDAANTLRWSVFVARARPGRSYFDAVHRFVPSNLNINTEGLAVLSDSSVVLSFVDFQRNVDGFTREGRLDRPRVWVMVSRDRGETFSIPLLVTESCGSGWSFLAADTSSGPHRNRLYHVCRNREGTAILLHHSADRGERWSNPIPVESPARDSATRSHPQVAVNREGVLGVVWIDGRDDSTRRCHAVYFTASLDGGQSFLPATRLSSELSCPDSTRNGQAFARWPKGGDYFGLAAAADGRFHAFWADARSSMFQIWTVPVTITR